MDLRDASTQTNWRDADRVGIAPVDEAVVRYQGYSARAEAANRLPRR